MHVVLNVVVENNPSANNIVLFFVVARLEAHFEAANR